MNIDLTKTQQYLEWLKNKLYLNSIASSAQNRIIYRGEVYRCSFGIGIGSEECKERLGNYITVLNKSEMAAIDNAILLSLGLNHQYQALQAMYNDKIQYLEKLKANRTLLQSSLESIQKEINEFQQLLSHYHFSDIHALTDFLENSFKNI